MKNCERCGSNIQNVGKYSSGRFCSRSCANARTWTNEINVRRGLSYLKTIGKSAKRKLCIVCGTEYTVSTKRMYSKLGMCSSDCRKIHDTKVLFERIEHGKVSNPKSLKRYLSDTVGYKCVWCDNTGIHRDITLVLQLDHIDGNTDNNKPENLRLLCPNCHSQTETFGNKSTRNSPKLAHRTEIQRRWRKKTNEDI